MYIHWKIDLRMPKLLFGKTLFLGASSATMSVSVLLHTIERVVAVLEVMEAVIVVTTMAMEATEERAAKGLQPKLFFWYNFWVFGMTTTDVSLSKSSSFFKLGSS